MIKFFKSELDRDTERLPAFEEGCWVDLVNPTDDEVEDASALTGIPEEMLKAALDEEETSRVERDEGTLLCIMDTPIITDTDEGDSYETIPMGVLFNGRCVVTVSLRGNSVLGDFISDRMAVSTSDPVQFLLSFMMGNAKRFLSNLRQIDKKSHRVQAELHRSMKNKELIQLLELENSLVYFSTSLSANISVYNKVGRLREVAENEDYRDYFDDVTIELGQAMEMCNIYRDILSGTMDAFASVISNNLNIVMKLLAVITFVISIPTLIASFWGMNVQVPFEGMGPWGFWVIVSLALVVSVVSAVFLVRYSNSIKVKAPRQLRRKRRRRPEE